MNNKWRNAGTWLSIFSIIASIFTTIHFATVMIPWLGVAFSLVMGVLTCLGILSNNNDGTFYWSPNTPWKVRLEDHTLWGAIIALIVFTTTSIMQWLHAPAFSFDLSKVLYMLLGIFEFLGVVKGYDVNQPPDESNPSTADHEVNVLDTDKS
jgi:uncharacterized membrane protein